MKPLVFIHIPKTAGTSFRYGLAEKLGENRLLMDYGPAAAETSAEIQDALYKRPDPVRQPALDPALLEGRVFCGHFFAKQYPFIKDFPVVTFVREPLHRLISEYYHGIREKHPRKDLVSYVMSPGSANRQYRMLEGVLDQAVVGVSDFYFSSLRLIFRKTGLAVPPLRLNMNPERNRSVYDISLFSREMLKAFRELNKVDYQLYEAAKGNLMSEIHASSYPRLFLDILKMCAKDRSIWMARLFFRYFKDNLADA